MPRMVAVRVAISGQPRSDIKRGAAGSEHLSGEGAWTAGATAQERALSYSERLPHRETRGAEALWQDPQEGRQTKGIRPRAAESE